MLLTITSTTVVTIQFTEVDFRLSPEDDQNLTVRIERRLAIAAPLSVLIYPIDNTLARAARDGEVTFEGERLQLPDEILIPDNNVYRPLDAKSELIIMYANTCGCCLIRIWGNKRTT